MEDQMLQAAQDRLLEKRDLLKKTTKEPQSKISTGLRMTTCHKHGEYEAKIIELFGEERASQCPACLVERERLEEEVKTRELEIWRKEKIEIFLKQSRVPKRFNGKTLEGFKPGDAKQRKILKVIEKYLEKLIDGACGSLIMCGRPGTGKTHLACAVIEQFIKATGKPAGYKTIYEMIQMVKDTYRKDSEETETEAIGRNIGVPFLVIDEVGVQFGTETEKLILYQVINGRYEEKLPTVLISNLTQEELISFIGERAFDRLKEDGGAVLAFDWGSYRR